MMKAGGRDYLSAFESVEASLGHWEWIARAYWQREECDFLFDDCTPGRLSPYLSNPCDRFYSLERHGRE